STANRKILTAKPIIRLNIKANPIEKSQPSRVEENNAIKEPITATKRPRTIIFIIGCSDTLKLAIKTAIITSTNIVSIISPYYFLLDLSFSVAALTPLEPACPIICLFVNITIPEALFLRNCPIFGAFNTILFQPT
ncbi:hypothetical protein RG402_003479, partial [Acinetobacter baumannii]|nr:hypothetical protein [Acinetobacter baumannii]